MSNIKPGQKLKDGDFCKNLTIEQAKELMTIDHTGFPDGYEEVIVENGVGFSLSWNGLFYIDDELPPFPKTEYNFADFKQLCENTFNNE